jgi:hypothetical protein
MKITLFLKIVYLAIIVTCSAILNHLFPGGTTVLTITVLCAAITSFSLLSWSKPTAPQMPVDDEIWAVTTDWELMQIHNIHAVDGRFIMFIGSKEHCQAYRVIMQRKD